jgi:hypothetical protein
MSTTTITDIVDPVAEGSDYELTATLYGPDGTTPVEPSAVATLTATLRSLDPGGGILFSDRNVKTYLTTGGAFAMPLLSTDLGTVGDRPLQRRMLTLKLAQSNGKKRNQAVRFTVEDLVDV